MKSFLEKRYWSDQLSEEASDINNIIRPYEYFLKRFCSYPTFISKMKNVYSNIALFKEEDFTNQADMYIPYGTYNDSRMVFTYFTKPVCSKSQNIETIIFNLKDKIVYFVDLLLNVDNGNFVYSIEKYWSKDNLVFHFQKQWDNNSLTDELHNIIETIHFLMTDGSFNAINQATELENMILTLQND